MESIKEKDLLVQKFLKDIHCVRLFRLLDDDLEILDPSIAEDAKDDFKCDSRTLMSKFMLRNRIDKALTRSSRRERIVQFEKAWNKVNSRLIKTGLEKNLKHLKIVFIQISLIYKLFLNYKAIENYGVLLFGCGSIKTNCVKMNERNLKVRSIAENNDNVISSKQYIELLKKQQILYEKIEKNEEDFGNQTFSKICDYVQRFEALKKFFIKKHPKESLLQYLFSSFVDLGCVYLHTNSLKDLSKVHHYFRKALEIFYEFESLSPNEKYLHYDCKKLSFLYFFVKFYLEKEGEMDREALESFFITLTNKVSQEETISCSSCCYPSTVIGNLFQI